MNEDIIDAINYLTKAVNERNKLEDERNGILIQIKESFDAIADAIQSIEQ